MEVDSLECRDDGEHSGVEFLEISNINATEDGFVFGAEPSCRVNSFQISLFSWCYYVGLL